MRKRQEFRDHHLHALVVQQFVAACRGEHGIDDQQRQIEFLDRRRHRLDDGRVAEHAGLHRVNLDVARHRLHLHRHEIGGEDERVDDAGRALRGNGSDRTRAVDAKCGERLEIRLNAGAAARVAAGNRERNACSVSLHL